MKAGRPARRKRNALRVALSRASGVPPSSIFSAKILGIIRTESIRASEAELARQRPVKPSSLCGAWRFESSLMHQLGAYVKGQTGELQIRQSRFKSGRPCQTRKVGHAASRAVPKTVGA